MHLHKQSAANIDWLMDMTTTSKIAAGTMRQVQWNVCQHDGELSAIAYLLVDKWCVAGHAL